MKSVRERSTDGHIQHTSFSASDDDKAAEEQVPLWPAHVCDVMISLQYYCFSNDTLSLLFNHVSIIILVFVVSFFTLLNTLFVSFGSFVVLWWLLGWLLLLCVLFEGEEENTGILFHAVQQKEGCVWCVVCGV